MAFSDCIDGALSEGALSRETADKAKQKFFEFVEEGEGVLSWRDREIRAAVRVEADMDRARVRRRRSRVLQAGKQAEIASRLALAPVSPKTLSPSKSQSKLSVPVV